MENNVPKMSFSPLTREDMPMVLSWFQEPHMRRIWVAPNSHEIFEKFLDDVISERDKISKCFVVSLRGTPFGYLQCYPMPDSKEEKTDASKKLMPASPSTFIFELFFIGDPSYLDKGLETLLIKEFIHYFKFHEPQINTLFAEPPATNAKVIQYYENAGFRRLSPIQRPSGKTLLMSYIWEDDL